MSIKTMIMDSNSEYEQHNLVTDEGTIYMIKDLKTDKVIHWTGIRQDSMTAYRDFTTPKYVKPTLEQFLVQYMDAITETDAEGSQIIEDFIEGKLRPDWKDHILPRFTKAEINLKMVDVKIKLLHDTLSGEIEYSITDGITWKKASNQITERN